TTHVSSKMPHAASSQRPVPLVYPSWQVQLRKDWTDITDDPAANAKPARPRYLPEEVVRLLDAAEMALTTPQRVKAKSDSRESVDDGQLVDPRVAWLVLVG